MFQSNELYEEVNHVVEHFGEAFVRLLAVSTQPTQRLEPRTDNPPR